MRQWLTPLCLSLALLSAGCLTTGRRGGDQSMQVYDLGVPPAVQRSAGLALEVSAPGWLDTPAVVYRLAYLSAAQVREYTQSRWVAAPAVLIERQLRRQLGYGTPSGSGRSPCLLRLELDEFSQVFTAANASHSLLMVKAVWLDRQRQPLLMRSLRLEQPATTADAGGGIAALTAAVAQLAQQLQAAESELPVACRGL